jgi:hypothetical protein
MRGKLLFTGLLLAFSLAVLPAQETKKDGPKPAPKSGVEVDIVFQNGSSVRALVQSEKLDIETPYGKLTVPIKNVRSIEFGSHPPGEVAERIQAAVKALGSGEFKERDKAATTLIELGPHSYAAVLEASRDKQVETARRAKEVLDKLQAKFPKKDLKNTNDDRVTTPTFPIVGRILTSSIKVTTDTFGDTEVKLADLRQLRSAGAVFEVDVAVDAGKYAMRGQWLATDFQVDGRTPIVITAKGQVDLAPGQGTIIVGPSGYRTGPGFGKKGMAKNAPGQLVGKIGESGETFVIGDRFEGTPSSEGKLYLQINPSPYSPQCSGSYDVKAMQKD